MNAHKKLLGIALKATVATGFLAAAGVMAIINRSKKAQSPELAPQRIQANPDEIRTTYHALAKKYHPDLAQAPETQKFMEEIMKKVNKAYQEKDIEKLRAFL